MPTTEERNTARIAELNDLARSAPGVFCVLLQTEGISALTPEQQSAIREKVETFTAFDEDNDPWGEHDFGSFDHDGLKVYFKFDYYDRSREFASPDPSDPAVTVRVLTILLASEY
jgi:hypothetical protein